MVFLGRKAAARAPAGAERIARAVLEDSRGIISDDLDRSMKIIKPTTTAPRIARRYESRDTTSPYIARRDVPAPVTRIYAVRDLLAELPDFKGPGFELGSLSAARQKEVKKSLGESPEESLKKLEDLVKEVIEPGTWKKDGKGVGIKGRAGTIIVTATPEFQDKITRVLEDLRSRKGQVEMGQRIATQRAEQRYLDRDVADVSTEVEEKAVGYDPVTVPLGLEGFILRNYSWHLPGPDLSIYGKDERERRSAEHFRKYMALFDKLQGNRGQKVLVSSVNLNVDAADAGALGITFRTGNNDLSFTVVDDAQLRTLLEMSAKNPMRVTGMNTQETIVGTDARFSNAMKGNVRFAGDFGNTLDVNANGISLPHEQYVLINNGRYLTAVKAGPMQHWTEKVTTVSFFEVPQSIDVPRVGRLVKLEKTLLNPEDELVIFVGYKQEGGGR